MGCSEVTRQPAFTNASSPARSGVFSDPRSKIRPRGARCASFFKISAVALKRRREHDEVAIQRMILPVGKLIEAGQPPSGSAMVT